MITSLEKNPNLKEKNKIKFKIGSTSATTRWLRAMDICECLPIQGPADFFIHGLVTNSIIWRFFSPGKKSIKGMRSKLLNGKYGYHLIVLNHFRNAEAFLIKVSRWDFKSYRYSVTHEKVSLKVASQLIF